jgi:hypothetical protein
MLQYQTTDPGTLELLRKLMQIGEFNGLRLVGGTSLALQIGHRSSIDIDMFGNLEVDEFEIIKILKNIGTTTLLKKTQNISIFLIDGIKVDLVNYPYPWLEEIIFEDNLRFAGIKDISAMKLAAITGRGTKKDFIDLYFLLQYYSLEEMLGFYKLKYNDASEMLVLKSLTWFADADAEENPRMLMSMDWEKVKDLITTCMQKYLKNL